MRDGMDLLYSLVGEYGCGERADMYYYTKYGSTRLRREYRTMLECGIDCAFLENGQSDIPDEYTAAVRIFNQLGLDATALGERLVPRRKIQSIRAYCRRKHRSERMHGKRIPRQVKPNRVRDELSSRKRS